MAKTSVVSKEEMIEEIIDFLEVKGLEKNDLTENLKKMNKKSINTLGTSINDVMIQREIDEDDEEDEEEVEVSENLLPHQIPNADDPAMMISQLKMLKTVSKRLTFSFENGEFHAIKRNVSIIERIAFNCRRLVEKQLWHNINVAKDLPGMNTTIRAIPKTEGITKN